MNVIETQAPTQSLKQEGQGLQDLVYSLVTRFLAENKTKSISDLYDMILSEVEPPLLQAVMEKRRGNQLQAAKMLGISRGTIRKKLQRYFGTKYFFARRSYSNNLLPSKHDLCSKLKPDTGYPPSLRGKW